MTYKVKIPFVFTTPGVYPIHEVLDKYKNTTCCITDVMFDDNTMLATLTFFSNTQEEENQRLLELALSKLNRDEITALANYYKGMVQS